MEANSSLRRSAPNSIWRRYPAPTSSCLPRLTGFARHAYRDQLASALRKPIVLLLHEDKEYAFLIRGLHAVGDVTYLYYTAEQDITERMIAAVLTAGPGPGNERHPSGR